MTWSDGNWNGLDIQTFAPLHSQMTGYHIHVRFCRRLMGFAWCYGPPRHSNFHPIHLVEKLTTTLRLLYSSPSIASHSDLLLRLLPLLFLKTRSPDFYDSNPNGVE
ncbi:hypothetical protein AVEN_6697-1 [Araneus ventricosus]|uniref:Uncharacterized protein n=1 Tax=Araneus ventricosus TaxID=182803 RepID=A0A4Y2ANC3_ARAVE|nr:hypothetical protein AVEN_6697-1 [Araneus ventricosus]